MTEQQQARFDGWAIVDVMGHQRYAGYVTTEAYGQAVLFRIDVPALPERERETKQPGYHDSGQYLPAGSIVKEAAVNGYTKLVGSGSIYTISPCDEPTALAALERSQHRPLMVIKVAEAAALPAKFMDDEDEDDDTADFEDDTETTNA